MAPPHTYPRLGVAIADEDQAAVDYNFGAGDGGVPVRVGPGERQGSCTSGC